MKTTLRNASIVNEGNILVADVLLANERIQIIVEKMSHHVADIYRIKERVYIREGYFADKVLIDLNKEWQVNSQNILYGCGWSPFENQLFKSKIIKTFVNGNLAFDDGQFYKNHQAKRL